MSATITLGSVTLLPLKEATEFVPYSRDYVTKLAREGKVVAAQIDRQWFVEVPSLQNFHAQSIIEESLKSKHLSLIRKSAIEVKQSHQSKLDHLVTKQAQSARVALWQTSAILTCGVGVGFLLTSVNAYSRELRFFSVAQIPHTEFSAPVTQMATVTFARTTIPAVEESRYITDMKLPLENGIVIMPSHGKTQSTPVADFFSDPVVVEMVTPTQGKIYSTHSSNTVTFVRVPNQPNPTTP